jgi:iron complex transport system substrate-binding protein
MYVLRKSIFPAALIVFTAAAISCSGGSDQTVENRLKSPDSIISRAKRLEIDKSKGYSQVSVINPWQGAGSVVHTWHLLPAGMDLPESVDPREVIRIPVRRVICMSTTHAAMISALGEADAICGFSGTGFLYDTVLLANVSKGLVHEVGYEDNLNKELILKLDPDLVVVYGVGSESSGYISKLKEMGVSILFNADYLEDDPLGKAEWIKLFGSLFSKEEMADSIFRDAEEKYLNLREHISRKTKKRPEIMLGLPFRDTWYVSPGNSYISTLINDAGGNYLWSSTSSQYSMPMGIESVYTRALSAEYWLNAGTASSLGDIEAIDPRLAQLPCFRSGNVFNNNRRFNSGGGNDYWETGAVYPHLVLNDIASIIHPELFPVEEYVYYRKLN